MAGRDERGQEETALLSIGALARASGVPVATLRTWERRYGFPRPQRKPSGHRVYPASAVPRVRRIAEALARGVRAGQVVGASDERVAELLAACAAPAPPPPATSAVAPADVLQAIGRYDAPALTHGVLAAWARLGPLECVRGWVAPLVTAVGELWERGTLEVRHEHFFSERLGDALRALRLPLEERARGPLVLLTTFPGELHGLGLQMAGLLLAAAGCRVATVGTQTPVEEIAQLARDVRARAVGISLSRATPAREGARQVRRLRARLPGRTALVVGGEGAPREKEGVLALGDLGLLDAWARRLVREAA